MLSIPNYYRSDDDQNDNEKSNPIWRNGYPNSLQTVHGEESREMTETPFMFPGNKHWQQPLEGTACTGQNKKVKRTKPKILIPTPGPTLQKTVIQNDTHTPQCSLKHCLQKPRQTPGQNVHGQMKAWKRRVYIRACGALLTRLQWILWEKNLKRNRHPVCICQYWQ